MSKKVRFEVFKRDNFTCQYCGKKPPDIMLEIDHILPKDKKGNDDILNLITSCFDCNRGKSNKELNTIPSTLEENAEILKEKQKQYKAYLKLIEKVHEQKQAEFEEVGLYFWGKFGKKTSIFAGKWACSIRMFLKMFNKYEIMEAMDIAFAKKGQGYSADDNTFAYMCGILWNWKNKTQYPGSKR